MMNWKEFIRLDKWKLLILVILITIGILNVITTHCNPIIRIAGYDIFSAFTCTDSPSSIEFIPGLYPPILFEETLVREGGEYNSVKNSFSWSCHTASCGFCPSIGVVTASCSMSPIVPIYVLIYWYLLSCILVALSRKPRLRNFLGRNRNIILISIPYLLFIIYLTVYLTIQTNLLVLMIVLIPLIIMFYFLLKYLEKRGVV